MTAYLVTCPVTVDAMECDVPSAGITAIAGPTYMQLKHTSPKT